MSVAIMSDRERREPSRISPRDAVERYLRRRQADATDQSVESYRYRLKLFVEWLQAVGVDDVGELRGFDFDRYFETRSGDVAPPTLENEMRTIRTFVEFLEQIEAVDDGLASRVRIPDVDDEDRVNRQQLAAEDAIPLLAYYRTSPGAYGTRDHVFLELAWTVGARMGGLRALDVRDVHLDDRFVEFVHRPETGTPLKRKRDGERPAAIFDTTADAIERYLSQHRHDVHDDHGRAPLLASERGRPSVNTLRAWSYMATQPCIYGPCPHGRERDTCEYTEREHSSKCPSSRSPHRIRTGSITWQLNQGLPPAVVAERVNATIATIEQHYDRATDQERRQRLRDRMERDRRPFVEAIELESLEPDQDDQPEP